MVLIDPRDGSKKLAECAALKDRCVLSPVEAEIDGKIVPCGDALMTGNGPGGGTITIGAEVKSLSDLLTSISTGRLGGTQMPRMLKKWDVTVLLYHGVLRAGPNNQLQVRRGKEWHSYRLGRKPVPYSYLAGFLWSIRMLATLSGRPLFTEHVYDLDEAATWLAVVDHWLEKPWDRHRALSVFDRSKEHSAPPGSDPVEEQIAKTAASFPAIDWVRGWRAARHFESVDEMINADVEEWMRVPGIGPVIGGAVVDAIRRRKSG